MMDVNPFPVPRSLAGKISGVIAYITPYIICTEDLFCLIIVEGEISVILTLIKNVYTQFQASKALDDRAVVVPNSITEVRTLIRSGQLMPGYIKDSDLRTTRQQESPFSTDVGQVNKPAGQERAWHTDSSYNEGLNDQ